MFVFEQRLAILRLTLRRVSRSQFLPNRYPPLLCSRCPHREYSRFIRAEDVGSSFRAKTPFASRSLFSTSPNKNEENKSGEPRENIYTLPNALTLSRILSCPVLGWAILNGNYSAATGILVYAGVSDWVDGFLARRYGMRSVLGSILDPAADKALMTTLTVTLALEGLIPVPLACIILGRDVLLSAAAFYIRYRTLPYPKTLHRYWDFSIPSAEVHPTGISKVNTALQLSLMGVTTVSPLLTLDLSLTLQYLQWMVAGTTIWSGLSYVFSTSAVRVIASKSPRKKP